MVIAYALFDIHLPGCRGLKEKRMIVRSLKSRIRNDFEVSVAEVDGQDLLQRASLGVGAVGPDQEPRVRFWKKTRASWNRTSMGRSSITGMSSSMCEREPLAVNREPKS